MQTIERPPSSPEGWKPSTPAVPAAMGSYEQDPRWFLAKRISASRSFGRSRLLTDFLLYVVERQLSGHAAEITEQQIGIVVFSREPGYDSTEDNIVRSYARTLRRRIQEFYEKEGRREPIVLDIPRGGYAPVFSDRAGEVTVEPQPAIEVPDWRGSPLVEVIEPAAVHAPAQPGPSLPLSAAAPIAPTARHAAVRWSLLALVAGIALGLAFAIAAHRWMTRDLFYPASDSSPLWSQIFSRDGDTFVVPSDDGLVIMQRLTERPVPLATYISGDYRLKVQNSADPAAQELLKLGARRYTSVADLEFVARLSQLHEVVQEKMLIRYARDLRMDDLRNGNAILIGSVEANPWIQLFQPQLNFRQQVVPGDRAASGIVNINPRKGEQAIYATPDNDHTYGLIAYLPNLTGTGHVLIVAGLNTAGTQAVTNFLLSPSQMKGVLQRARTSKGELRPFEVLVGAGNVAANASTAEIVAERVGADR